jgi:hypothetical protein
MIVLDNGISLSGNINLLFNSKITSVIKIELSNCLKFEFMNSYNSSVDLFSKFIF